MTGSRGKRWLYSFIERCVRELGPIDLDGPGSLVLVDDKLALQKTDRKQVFIGYAKEDRAKARKLFRELKAHGFEPWMDEEKLLPGQNWPRAIEHAIEASDYVVMCFSPRAVNKRGFFQCELRYALDAARSMPLDGIYLVPVRLAECSIPRQIARTTQYVDLFPDWQGGIKALLNAMTDRNQADG